MSERFYYNQFKEAMLELLEIVKLEQFPGELNQTGKAVISASWSFKDWTNFFVSIYIKYIGVLKKIESSYDQLTHPQMRKTILKFLENCLCRVVQIKKEILFYNNPVVEVKPLLYVFLDDHLIDLKLPESVLDLPIPRYFREDYSDNTKIRRTLIDERLKDKYGNTLPEEDKTKVFFQVELNFEEAIKIIQNFELGRQNLKRINKSLKLASQEKVENDLNEKKILMEDERKKLIMEQLIATNKLKTLKEKENIFLKMEKDPTLLPIIDDADKIYQIRKHIQREKEENYKKYKEELKEKILTVEGYEIKEGMKSERKEWITKFKLENRGEPPHTIDLFYKRFEVEAREELDESQRKALDNIIKEKTKKEQEKKKKDENGPIIQVPLYAGPTKQVKNLTTNIEEFKKYYEKPSEYISQTEDVNNDLARYEIIEEVEGVIKQEVDLFIQNEIRNLRTIFLNGKKDPKVPKASNKANSSNAPKGLVEKLTPAEKALLKTDIHQLFSDAVMHGIVRKMVPKKLDDLIEDFNWNAFSSQVIDENMIDVPLFYTKQLIKELCIYPLGCPLVRNEGGLKTTSILFYGPPGTGKTHAALSIAYHTDALFFDFSLRNLEGKFSTNEELSQLVATCIRVAKQFQPAIFYFDNAEQIFMNTRAKGAVKDPIAQKVAKLLITYKNNLHPNHRILFIGCTNKGWQMSQKDFDKMFERSLYFSLPSFSDRYKIWKTEIIKNINRNYDLEYDLLAQMSNGYSAESIKQCINYTLTPQRKEKLKFKSLEVNEFISALSKTEYFYKTEFTQNRNFHYKASGLFALHEYLRIKKEENEKKSGKNRK